MGNLFNKYLLSRILEGIPMPSTWQESFGIKLEGSAQVEIEKDSEGISNGQQLSGYIFGRDNPLGRGFIRAKNLSEILGRKEKYMIQLLLEAIKDHEGADYTNYFNGSETSKVNGNYEVTIPVIAGGIYTIIGTSELPATWSYYSELSGQEFASGEWGSLTVPRRINTTDYSEETSDYTSEQEYFMIKVVASSKVIIVRGKILPQSMFNRFDCLRDVKNGEKVLLPQLPSILRNIEYSNKLIPSLLGMKVSKDSSQELKQNIFSQLSRNGAQTLEEAVELSTNSIYDRDGNIGGKLLW